MAFRFEHLEIWGNAIQYALHVYKTTKTFPKEEMFALSDQLKRSANSIPANIAEGSGSSSNKDFCHYLDITIKSLYETISHLQLAKELAYISEGQRLILYKEAEVLVKKIQAFKNTIKQ